MAPEEQIKSIVLSVLESRFKDIEIYSIEVTPDVDEDGDRVFAVKIVFDGSRTTLDARETSSLVRRILPMMEKIGERGFPIMSFIAKSELGKSSPGSA
ncbi:MAG: hypothetical protein MI920_12620 [Kiloniellales bacterium]|nr:hypothetical protein [Kiloniellales bacterium]